jgi:endonuclease/exonuclease/phosphatase family metal-dependent hydrolase
MAGRIVEAGRGGIICARGTAAPATAETTKAPAPRRTQAEAQRRGTEATTIGRGTIRGGRPCTRSGLELTAITWGGWYLWQHRQRPADVPPTASTQPLNPGDRVRIATWNLRKFSDREQNPPDLVTIARIVKDNAFDVVAIQEVQQQGQVAQKLRRQLNEPWRVAVTEQTGNHERYAFLYRSDRVELLDTPRLVDSAEASSLDRRPAIATFKSGNFDFILLTAHLWYGDKANNPRRRAEAAALARIATGLATRGPERDVIVLGDFNEMRASGNLHLFESNGWQRLNREPTNLGSNEVYDNLLIDPRNTREFAGATGVVKFDEAVFGGDDKRAMEAVSDHRPAWAEFSTTMADDD